MMLLIGVLNGKQAKKTDFRLKYIKKGVKLKMKLKGLTTEQVEESRKQHGANTLTEIPADPLWKKVLEGFKDPMIMILLVALVVQVILWIMGQAEWYEPAGVLIAIMIANGVSSISESKQEGKASALKAEELAKEMAKVIRDGQLIEIHVSDVVVGDIVFLQAGDKIAADGNIVEGEIKVDQAALNGETEEAEKIPGDSYDINDLLNKHYVYRGTVVCSGEAYIEIKVVGDNTLFGKLALEVQEETRETPLQVKLGKLAKQISTFGYVGAICIVVGVLAKTLIGGNIPDNVSEWIRLIIDAVTVAVTVIVCAVPEGLPMLTSILLSFQSLRMAKDNVLVRKINGLETAGSLSILFSDKTGTITEGKLSVVELALGNATTLDALSKLPKSMVDDMIVGVGVNNSSTASNGEVIGGNSTDRAMMKFLVDSGVADSVDKNNVVNFSAFDSNKKSSSVTVKADGKTMTYVKGAAERIVERCTHFTDENGDVHEFTDAYKTKLTEYSDAQASRSMRLLGVAKVDGDDENKGLTLLCVLSIRDNVRKEAADAIKEVQNAGIQVVMVTGDRKETAAAISKEAGLLTSPEHVVLTSAEMAEKSDDELKAILPNLRVVARALPMDKSRLVRVAQELNYVVGMTGDGVNDSPALKKADVGFAMGSGTEVAKDAGDITIMDDNFSSIEKAILYGRTMFKSIRKFLIFQLTVNVAAVLTCFISPLLGENVALTVIQLLLINLAMDTLAAIAFGSEPALKEYMKEKPIPRSAGIISKDMLIEILISALYITVICLGILFFPFMREMFGIVGESYKNLAEMDKTVLKSALFATFMMAITFNGFNARTNHLNIFDGIGKNKSFLVVMLSIFLVQLIFVSFGGDFLSVTALNPMQWLVCILLAVMVIPLDLIRKLFTSKK